LTGNHKRSDISIAKFTAETREVGQGVPEKPIVLFDPEDNKTSG